MPTFWYKENLIHFAAHKNHLGLYPGPEAILAFQEQLKPYKSSKGAVQLPYHQPIDYELLTDIVIWRLDYIKSKFPD